MVPPTAIARVREFNRRWTELLGLLDRGLLKTEYSLTESRVIFELAQRTSWERLALRDRLGIDPSFLTRVLRRLQDAGLVESHTSESDGRALDLSLSSAGRRAYEMLDRRSSEQVASLLDHLSVDQLGIVLESMTVLTRLIVPEEDAGAVSLRGLNPGDLGWVVQRHGSIYSAEYGWNQEFEALVARIVADYADGFDREWENAWVAELDGARAGCVFCCRRDETTAQLRILLVEPWARGHGIGHRLVDECVRFARRAGYSRVVLWTNDVLSAARRIYESVGFELLEEEEHHSFGHDLVGQNWAMDL